MPSQTAPSRATPDPAKTTTPAVAASRASSSAYPFKYVWWHTRMSPGSSFGRVNMPHAAMSKPESRVRQSRVPSPSNQNTLMYAPMAWSAIGAYMRVFWFDGEGTRDWRTLLSGFDIAAWGILTRPKLEPGDILVCHQTYLNGEALELAREAATAGVVVLAVSGVALDGAVCDGIYYRATPVDRPTDKSFSEAFRRFARALQASG